MQLGLRLVTLGIISALLCSCAQMNHATMSFSRIPATDSNLIVTKSLALPSLHDIYNVSITSPVNITITDGKMNSRLSATGPKPFVSSLLFNISGHTLNIILATTPDANCGACTINLQLPRLAQLYINNGANVSLQKQNPAPIKIIATKEASLTSHGTIQLQKLFTQNSGAITINQINTSQLQIELLGMEHVMLRGQAINGVELIKNGSGSLSLIGHASVNRIINYSDGPIVINQASSEGLSIADFGPGYLTITGSRLNVLNLEANNNAKVLISGIYSGDMAVAITNQAEVHLGGRVSVLNARASQYSVLDAYSLAVKRLYIKTQQQATAHVRPINVLDAYARDSSDVYYYQQSKFIAPMLYTAGSVLPMFRKAPPYPIVWDHAEEYWLQQ